MKRTLVQLDDAMYQELRRRAFREGRSISSLVREMLAKGLAGDTARARPARLSEFASVRAGRSKQARLAPISEKHDAALAAVEK